MSSRPDPLSPPPGGLLGVLRSWLNGWSNPWEPSDAFPIDRETAQANADACPRVLVVDDNPVNLMVMSAMLSSRGLEPVLAQDGAEAVALACELHFDLILMDLQMPILDGWDATVAIRRFEHTTARSAVPIVAYSSTRPEAREVAARGMNGSLNKPCEDQDVEDCLVRWCPTYRPEPALNGVAHGAGGWQAASRPGPESVALR